MALKTTKFDPARYLETEQEMAAYISEALATGDPEFIADALGVVARAQGMSGIARQTGLSRENLYRALSTEGNPELGTILRVVGALGLRLAAVPAKDGKDRRRRKPTKTSPRKAA